MWEMLNPNDVEEFVRVLTGKNVELIWKSTMTLCKGSMKDHRKGTDGRLGDPENYSN